MSDVYLVKLCNYSVNWSFNNNNNNNNNNIYLFTAIGLLPGGSDYFTYKQNMKLVTTNLSREDYMRTM